MRNRLALLLALAFLLISTAGYNDLPGQEIPMALPAVPAFPLETHTSLHIERDAVPNKPFSVIGPRGAILGQQDGRFEVWNFPWKILSDMRMTAEMENYPVPIDVNQLAAQIDVTPGATTITYSHANFTIRQVMCAPKTAADGTGILVLYQIEAIRPMTLTFSFDPVMRRMWPAPSDAHPSPEWVKSQGGSSGFYILRESFPGTVAALAMSETEPGVLQPYQERPAYWPLQFVLHFDPHRDRNLLFPLLVAVATAPEDTSVKALAAKLAGLNASVQSQYENTQTYYSKLLDDRTTIDTPDKNLNAAFSWSIVAIDQLRQVTPERKGEALTAGFVGSGDSDRPGFGWFFGRDALWSLYAVSSYGDFNTTKQEIEFLLRHQRADGKIMHEYSQTANLVDWQALPYEFAAADPTPLLLMAANDYWKISGDTAFIQANWEGLARAWNFELAHAGDDGIYNNAQGTGWVESWIPSMPHEEIYLALLDEQASLAFANLARSTGHQELGERASARASQIGSKIEQGFFKPASGFYAFSRNADRSTDDTATIFPAVGWWDGSFALAHPDAMMRRWASDEFSTDWGARILSDRVPFYDPISYHQGSVWPLFTGWVALAEYRAGDPLAGYASLMQNADLTLAQDLGSVTELLSGKFFQMLGRSSAHQLWSSAMVVTPVLRGLFGLEWDASKQTLNITPHLPATWDSATLRHVPLGNSTVDLIFTRRGRELVVEAAGGPEVHLESGLAGATFEGRTLHIPLPAIELAAPTHHLPLFGADTEQPKILGEQREPRRLTVALSAPGGSRETFFVRENIPDLQLRVTNGVLKGRKDGLEQVQVDFPPGDGYVDQALAFSW